MFPTPVRGADCRYLAPLIGLKELAVVCKFLAYYRDRCTSIQKRSDGERLLIFEADSTPSLDNVT